MALKFLSYFVLAAISIVLITANAIPNQQVFQSGFEQLDELYEVSWSLNEEDKTIHFSVVASVKGWVGLGFTPNAGMTNADLFIGGVNDDGTLYGSDYYGTRDGPPTEDESKDWTIDEGHENDTHTYLAFHRNLDTGDNEHDVQITEETMILIWAVGALDNLDYHGGARGTKYINFYAPETTTQQDGNTSPNTGSTGENAETTTESSGHAFKMTPVLVLSSVLAFFLW